MSEIIFSGGSFYGLNSFISLQEYFERIYVLRNNPIEIINRLRTNDILIDDFTDSSCPFVFLSGHVPFISETQLFSKTYVNMHGALLPKYRGMNPTFWAIMNEEKELGITYHLVDKHMDSGDIIAQFSYPYTGQIVQEINENIKQLVLEHSGHVLSDFIDKKIIPVPQNSDEVLFGCKRNKDDCLIDFEWSNRIIGLFFKALTYPYPLPRICMKNKIFEVLEYKIIERNYFGAVGRVVNIDDMGIWIKTKEGFLVVSKIRNVETEVIEDPRFMVKTGYRMQKILGSK